MRGCTRSGGDGATERDAATERDGARDGDTVGHEVESAFAADLALSMRVLRASRGLSQRELAEAVGVSKSAVARLEAGSLPPVVARWLTTVRALGLEVSVVPRRDEDRMVVPPPHRDAAGRLFPAHGIARWQSMPPTWWFVRNGGWGTTTTEPEWFWRRH